MAKVNQSQEPSMEEILASIRRIIADDEPVSTAPAEIAKPEAPRSEFAKPAAPLAADNAGTAPADHELIANELPVAPALQAEPQRARQMPDAPPILPFQSRIPAPAAAQYQAAKPHVPSPQIAAMADEMRDSGPLLSPSSDAIVQSAFGNLANTILAGNQRTLEDLVKDMLRPMLKAWLDTNLPPLVEKLVRDEIERVSRGR